jgi:HEAT repeat protein
MQRKTATLLIMAALLGTALTITLLALVLGGRSTRTRQASEDRGRRPGESLRIDPDASGRPRRPDGVSRIGREPRRAPGSTVRPGERIPRDSAETRLMRLEASSRVIEILDGIMSEKDRTKRWQMNEELKKLLRTLGSDASPVIRERLLEMLRTVEPQWAALVGDALASMRGDAKTARALITMLEEDSPNAYRRNAIYAALGKMGVREVSGKLLSMLGQGNADEAKIVQTLGQIGGPAEVQALFEKLDGVLVTNTRREIERVLRSKFRTPGLMNQVAGALSEAEPEARASLLRILSASKHPEHAQKVRDLLVKETDSKARTAAIEALGEFGDPESGRVLLELAQRGDAHERRRAIEALHRIRNPRTIDGLVEDWAGLDQGGRVAVMGAAARLPLPTDKLFTLARTEGLHDKSRRVRAQAAKLLGRPRRDENVDPLVNYLNDAKRPNEATTALTSLLQIGTRKAAEEAMRALRGVSMLHKKQRDAWMKRFEKIYDQQAGVR